MKKYFDAAQSLKLYRRAELVGDNDEKLIETLYVDPLQNNGVLDTMLRPNTTFLIGRKGTGKSTVFQRSQHEIRKGRRSISAYVDIKTVFESASVDPDVQQKLSSMGVTLSADAVQRILLYRAFTRAIFQDIQKELRGQVSTSFLARAEEAITAQRQQVISAIDELLEGAFEAEILDVTGAFSSSVQKAGEQKTSSKANAGASGKASAGATGSGTEINAEIGWEGASENTSSAASEYSKILLRTFNINSIMERLEAILSSIGVHKLYIFIDDFSELPQEAMVVFVDTLLAPLNNWSNELIKFKIAAYPNRIYLGKIDPTKIDELYLDTFRLYGSGDVSTMEDKAIDFVIRLLDSRFEKFLGKKFEEFCDAEAYEVHRQLFFASMGNPRILGHLLHNIGESHIAYGKKIGVRAVQDAAGRYYEEKVEPFFGMQKYVHQSFDERSSVFSLKELTEALVERAKELRDYKESAVTREISGRTPSSHLHVLSEFDALLSTLELNFFVTKYFEMKDRDGRKVSVYALNYGLCTRYSISFGRPSGKREHRLYFVERIFDYTPILKRYIQLNQEIRCEGCGAVHGLDKLESIRLFDMMCPTCKQGKCEVINLSRKYEAVLKQIDDNLLLPRMELGILETLYLDDDGLAAADIAAELDCSYQLVGKRGKILAERGLVDRDTFLHNRRQFKITESAREDYFASNGDRQLQVPTDE